MNFFSLSFFSNSETGRSVGLLKSVRTREEEFRLLGAGGGGVVLVGEEMKEIHENGICCFLGSQLDKAVNGEALTMGSTFG